MSTPESNPRAPRVLRTQLGSALAALGAGAWRTIAAALVAAMIAANALAASAAARPTAPACPDTVIPNVPIIPNAVGCWNAIAVQATHLAAPYNVQGLIYMGYVQAAVYDAVTKIDGRYEPYHQFSAPSGVDVASASPDAAAAAAAYTMLTSSFLGFPATAQAGLSTQYSDYINALGGVGAPGVEDGIQIGQAAASDLIAERTGDRNEVDHVYPRAADPRRVDVRATAVTSDGADAVGGGDETVHAQQPVAVPRRASARALEQEMGQGVQRGQGLRRSEQHRPLPASRPQSHSSGTRTRSTSQTKRSKTSRSPIGWTSSTRRGCSRWVISSTATRGSRAGTPNTTTCSGGRSWRSETPKSTAIPRPRPIPTGRRC